MVHRALPFLALAALALLLAWPSLRYGPPNTTDGPNHFYRAVALDWHIRHGDFYPRWFSDLHYGFGAPVLNFYAPLSYYMPVLIHFLGIAFPTAFELAFLLALTLTVWGLYCWGRDQFGAPLAGYALAVAMAMSPAMDVNLLSTGNLPLAWALAIVPWLLWAVLRWVRHPKPIWQVAVTVLLAALILTHNVSALMFGPLVAVYYLGLLLDARKVGVGSLLRLGWVMAQGLLLAAFFLLPFVLEAGNVQLERATAAQIFQYQNNFLEWQTIFAAPVHFDPQNVINSQPVSLPWPALGLAVVAIGLLVIRWKEQPYRYTTLFLALAAGATILLMNYVGGPIWKALPPLQLLQFPARLMSLGTLLIAWLAAAAIPSGRWQWLGVAAFAVVTFFFTLPWTYHDPFPPFPNDPQPADLIRYEIESGALGTTFTQEFVPPWVQTLPDPNTLLPRYAGTEIPSRIASVPDGLTIQSEQAGIKSTAFNYSASQSTPLVFDIFYFPGWEAQVDGAAVPVTQKEPQGLITVNLPAGAHQFELSLQPTGPQGWGTVLSLLALMGLLLPFRFPAGVEQAASTIARERWQLPIAWAGLFTGLLVLRIAVLDRVETPFNYSELNSIAHPASANFSDQLKLLGYDYPDGGFIVSGETLNLKLYWQAAQPLSANYQTTVQLVDAAGNHFGQSDNQNPGGLPTSGWRPDRYAIDLHRVQVVAGTPPGDYHLQVGVYALDQGATHSLALLTDGVPNGLTYDLGTVTVTRAPSLSAAEPLHFTEGSLGTSTVAVGDALTFTVAFVTGPAPTPGLQAQLQLVNAANQVMFTDLFDPGGPKYPANQWMPNELIRYPQAILLPPNLPAGLLHASLTFIQADGIVASPSFDLGAVTITVPNRSFDIPAMQTRVNHDFGQVIRLLGYDRTADTLTLYWQSLQPTTTQYTVFIHRLDNQGNFVAGGDGLPVRPTTSWLPGEVITDPHQFAAGDRFEIGLYDPITGGRLGETFVVKP